MWIADLIRKAVSRLFPKAEIEKATGREVAISDKMRNAVALWNSMYVDTPSWKGENCQTMNLPSAIAHEFARLITLECDIHVDGSEYLDDQFQTALSDFDNIVELYCAKGGIVMKPYVSGDRIEVDFTQAENFFPTEYENKKITGAIFVDHIRSGKFLYTRLEIHEFKENQVISDGNGTERRGNVYTVENKAYKSEQINNDAEPLYPFNTEIPLESVPKWSGIAPKTVINDIDRPLFVYVRVPAANNIDPKSPLGASVYARAADAIRNADEQYTQSKYEYEAFEAAIDAGIDLFKKNRDGTPVLPAGKERVFRNWDTRETDGEHPFLKEFAPAFRDNSLFNGLDHYLKIIEFLCELTYGTISDPTSVEKTATEIISSKQRSYSAVSNMQRAWERGFNDLLYAMSVLATLYGLPAGQNYELSVTWGDGILEDADKEFQRRWSMVAAGKYKPEKFFAWYFGCSEEEAKEYIPEGGGMLPEFE